MKEEINYLPGLKLRDITFDAPLDCRHPEGDTIRVFARIVTGEEGGKRPYLIFFQGGPGSEDPRPALWPSSNPIWLKRTLKEYQVVLLDQRGTGGSTPISANPNFGPLAGKTPQQQAEYLTHMRADEIVNDAEALRQILGVERWTLLGQSFGGFTSLHYLSVHPESLAGVIFTGGLSAVRHSAEEIYAATWEIMVGKSRRYYRAFPTDRDRVRRVADLASQGKIVLPNGDKVSPERWRTVGIRLGMQGGSMQLHNLLDLDPLSPAFQHDLDSALPFGGRNPLYAILHESSYADGVSTRWAADRTMPQIVKDDATLLGGEHIHRSLFTENSQLAPLREAADLIAQHEWNQLYFPEAIKRADVPVAAIAYFDDAYVPLQYSLETARLLQRGHVWVTNEYEHNGLRQDARVIERLIDLLKGRKTQ